MITYKEFQIKVMADVFKKQEKNTFEPALYMLTKNNRRKIGPIPAEMFEDKDVVRDTCIKMNKIAGSIYCCFVSECNFTKVDKEECESMGIDFEKLGSEGLTNKEADMIRKLAVEGLVFNFDSINDSYEINVFKKVNNTYIPLQELNQENGFQEDAVSGTFTNLLSK